MDFISQSVSRVLCGDTSFEVPVVILTEAHVVLKLPKKGNSKALQCIKLHFRNIGSAVFKEEYVVGESKSRGRLLLHINRTELNNANSADLNWVNYSIEAEGVHAESSPFLLLIYEAWVSYTISRCARIKMIAGSDEICTQQALNEAREYYKTSLQALKQASPLNTSRNIKLLKEFSSQCLRNLYLKHICCSCREIFLHLLFMFQSLCFKPAALSSKSKALNTFNISAQSKTLRLASTTQIIPMTTSTLTSRAMEGVGSDEDPSLREMEDRFLLAHYILITILSILHASETVSSRSLVVTETSSPMDISSWMDILLKDIHAAVSKALGRACEDEASSIARDIDGAMTVAALGTHTASEYSFLSSLEWTSSSLGNTFIDGDVEEKNYSYTEKILNPLRSSTKFGTSGCGWTSSDFNNSTIFGSTPDSIHKRKFVRDIPVDHRLTIPCHSARKCEGPSVWCRQ